MCPFQSAFEEWREKRSYCKLVSCQWAIFQMQMGNISHGHMCVNASISLSFIFYFKKKKKKKITDQFVPILSPQTNQVAQLAVRSNSRPWIPTFMWFWLSESICSSAPPASSAHTNDTDIPCRTISAATPHSCSETTTLLQIQICLRDGGFAKENTMECSWY